MDVMTPTDVWDCGWSAGWSGCDVERSLAEMRVGVDVTPDMEAAYRDGHATAVRDRADYGRDMAAGPSIEIVIDPRDIPF